MEKIIEVTMSFYEPSFIERYIEYLLIIVLLASFMEVVFPPIPGDTILVLCGSLAGVAQYNPILVVGSAFLGSFGASVLLYFFGLKLGRKFLDAPRLSWFLDSKTFQKIEYWFNRYGFITVLASRFLPICRSGIILAAGIIKMEKYQALIAVGLSTVISTAFFLMGGYYMGRRWQVLIELWNSQTKVIIIALASILIGYIILIKIKKHLAENNSEG